MCISFGRTAVREIESRFRSDSGASRRQEPEQCARIALGQPGSVLPNMDLQLHQSRSTRLFFMI
jgi:hypothetical protein